MDFQNTDLALEVREQFEENQVEVPGVVLRKKRSADGKVLTTFVEILDKEGEKAMGKPVGIYVTMESREEIQKESALKEAVCQELREILGKRKIQSVLVAGVGNRQITSDSLGPETIDRLIVTRHLYDDGQKKGISAIAPGVMGQTGMEAQEVLQGIVSATKPDCVLVIDALMAREADRLCTTVQITDTGITPGAGIGNKRAVLNEETLGVPVFAVGVPTVVASQTIIRDCVESALKKMDFSQEEIHGFLEDLMKENQNDFVVTPKNIDECIHHISIMLAAVLNEVF